MARSYGAQLSTCISHISLTANQTCTLLTANTPSSVGHLYRFVTHSGKEKDVQSAVRNAALMREAALKSSIFVGVPRVCRITPHHSTSRFCCSILSVDFLFARVTGNRSSCGTHRRARRRREGWPADKLTQVRCFRFSPIKVFPHWLTSKWGRTPRIPTPPPGPPPRKTSTPSLLAGPRSGTPYTSRTPSSCTINSRRITLTSSVGFFLPSSHPFLGRPMRGEG